MSAIKTLKRQLVAFGEIARIDEVVDRGLHVHVRRQTPASAKRKAGGEDRFALRLADDAVGQLGALSICRSTTAGGSLVKPAKICFSSCGLASDQRRASS